MAALAKVVQVSKAVNNVSKLLANCFLSPSFSVISKSTFVQRIPLAQCSLVHTTSKQNGLMEFFDDPKNWEKEEIKVGRSWRKDELRIKSNEDLHKLWFVLLKERNMLLTMEEACNREFKIFPNPERLDKVEESMENLESVVRERNIAYHMLETGDCGERPAKLVYNAIGMRFYYKMCQYVVPKFMNSKWYKKHMFGYNGYAVRNFQRLYREKLWNKKRKAKNQQHNRVAALLKRFPNMDLEALKEQYPQVDIDRVKQSKKAQPHIEQT